MNILWTINQPSSIKAIGHFLLKYKRNRINYILNSLLDKGLITVQETKKGSVLIQLYEPIITAEEYYYSLIPHEYLEFLISHFINTSEGIEDIDEATTYD
ncbi:MAG: hypothetical protein M3Z38_01715 [Bombilactobacillus mellifer]|nr:hypothetical protein [Bombilactobacillus mellifer]